GFPLSGCPKPSESPHGCPLPAGDGCAGACFRHPERGNPIGKTAAVKQLREKVRQSDFLFQAPRKRKSDWRTFSRSCFTAAVLPSSAKQRLTARCIMGAFSII